MWLYEESEEMVLKWLELVTFSSPPPQPPECLIYINQESIHACCSLR